MMPSVLSVLVLFVTVSALLYREHRERSESKSLSGSSSYPELLCEKNDGRVNKKLRQLREAKIEQMKLEAEALFQRQRIELSEYLDKNILPKMYAQAEDPTKWPGFRIYLKDVNAPTSSIPDILSDLELQELMDALGELLMERGIISIRQKETEKLTSFRVYSCWFLVDW